MATNTLETPTRTQLKQWLKQLLETQKKTEEKIKHVRSLLELEESSSPKNDNVARKKRAGTVEFEEHVRAIFTKHDFGQLKLQDLLTELVTLYPEGKMDEKKARIKVFRLEKAGFLDSPQRGIYELHGKEIVIKEDKEPTIDDIPF